jgi:hypothetical protein
LKHESEVLRKESKRYSIRSKLEIDNLEHFKNERERGRRIKTSYDDRTVFPRLKFDESNNGIYL